MILAGAEPFFLPRGRHGVILMHGFTGLPAEMQLLGWYLHERGLTVLAPRLAGHGTTAEDMSRMTGEDWLDSLRDAYAILSGCCDDVSFAGLSMGGTLGLLLAAEKPLRRLVLMSTPIFIAPERGADRLPPRRFCRGRYAPKDRKRMPGVPAAVNHTYREIPLLGVHELIDLIKRSKSCLPQVKSPLLILHSRNDHTASPESAEYIYDRVGSACKEIVWLEKSGHLLPLDTERETVFEKAADFLS